MEKLTQVCDYWKTKVNYKFDSVWNNHWGKAQGTLVIVQMENYDLGLKGANVKIPKKTKVNQCNQCNYGSSHTGNLRTHLKTHIGGKSNKCQ